MTQFDNLKSKSIDDFVQWLKTYTNFDNSPWIKWWDGNYCSKCEAEIATFVDTGKEAEFAYCEIYSKCKFFQEMEKEPTYEEIIKMWLESEVEDGSH